MAKGKNYLSSIRMYLEEQDNKIQTLNLSNGEHVLKIRSHLLAISSILQGKNHNYNSWKDRISYLNETIKDLDATLQEARNKNSITEQQRDFVCLYAKHRLIDPAIHKNRYLQRTYKNSSLPDYLEQPFKDICEIKSKSLKNFTLQPASDYIRRMISNSKPVSFPEISNFKKNNEKSCHSPSFAWLWKNKFEIRAAAGLAATIIPWTLLWNTFNYDETSHQYRFSSFRNSIQSYQTEISSYVENKDFTYNYPNNIKYK